MACFLFGRPLCARGNKEEQTTQELDPTIVAQPNVGDGSLVAVVVVVVVCFVFFLLGRYEVLHLS